MARGHNHTRGEDTPHWKGDDQEPTDSTAPQAAAPDDRAPRTVAVAGEPQRWPANSEGNRQTT